MLTARVLGMGVSQYFGAKKLDFSVIQVKLSQNFRKSSTFPLFLRRPLLSSILVETVVARMMLYRAKVSRTPKAGLRPAAKAQRFFCFSWRLCAFAWCSLCVYHLVDHYRFWWKPLGSAFSKSPFLRAVPGHGLLKGLDPLATHP